MFRPLRSNPLGHCRCLDLFGPIRSPPINVSSPGEFRSCAVVVSPLVQSARPLSLFRPLWCNPLKPRRCLGLSGAIRSPSVEIPSRWCCSHISAICSAGIESFARCCDCLIPIDGSPYGLIRSCAVDVSSLCSNPLVKNKNKSYVPVEVSDLRWGFASSVDPFGPCRVFVSRVVFLIFDGIWLVPSRGFASLIVLSPLKCNPLKACRCFPPLVQSVPSPR